MTTSARPSTAWLIGGVPFFSTGWDQAPGRIGDDYEAVPVTSGVEAWTVSAGSAGAEGSIDLDARRRSVYVDSRIFPQPAAAFREGAARALLHLGRTPLHAALVVAPASSAGVLIVGASGSGKSSLTWLALSLGWRVVSDDYVALRAEPSQSTTALAVRKGWRVPAHLVGREAREHGRRMISDTGLRKVRLDPDRLSEGVFLREAEIGRIAFVERATTPSLATISPADTLGRLLPLCTPSLIHATPGHIFRVLADLARASPARVAGLTSACLGDPRVLQELAA